MSIQCIILASTYITHRKVIAIDFYFAFCVQCPLYTPLHSCDCPYIIIIIIIIYDYRPSFRDEEVVWDNVRILKRSGETVSADGTHLG